MEPMHQYKYTQFIKKKKKIAFSFLLKFSDLCCTFWKVFDGEERLTTVGGLWLGVGF